MYENFPQYGDCEDIVIQGCTLTTSAALKIGTESAGNFRRIVATGIRFVVPTVA